MENEKKIRMEHLALELKGRQSVRATFKLTKKAIETVNIVSTHMRIKQKALFDHLMENNEAFITITKAKMPNEIKKTSKVQKTYVMSKKTLLFLEKTSRSLDTSRNLLMEHCIRQLLPIIEQERGRHEERKKILDEMNENLEKEKALLAKSRKTLGDDDMVTYRLENAVAALECACRSVGAFVEKGDIIEGFF